MYTIKDGIFVGLSTDTKPTGIDRGGELPKPIPNGFKLYEINTGKRFLYDAENKTWIERQSGGSGGGSGGGSNLPDVTAEDNGKVLGVDDGAWAAVTPKTMIGDKELFVINIVFSAATMGNISDKTYAEVDAAYTAGKLIIAFHNGEVFEVVRTNDTTGGWCYKMSHAVINTTTNRLVKEAYVLNSDNTFELDNTNNVAYALGSPVV